MIGLKIDTDHACCRFCGTWCVVFVRLQHFWVELKTTDGNVYYYNKQSQVSQWDKPEELRDGDDDEKAVRIGRDACFLFSCVFVKVFFSAGVSSNRCCFSV